MKISVLMSVYRREKPEALREAFDSILSQTHLPTQIVLVEDGPLTKALYLEIERLKEQFPRVDCLRLEKNQGLGIALQQGLLLCEEEWVARADADDRNCPDRLEQQVSYLKEHPEISVLGGQIQEFFQEGGQEYYPSKRVVPQKFESVCRFAKRRNPLNHMTVLFRKKDVLEVGNYQPATGFEDYYLWLRLLKAGYTLENLPQVLTYARVGRGMIGRRGGISYISHSLSARYRFLQEGLIGKRDFFVTAVASVLVGILPSWLREKIYYNLLHKRVK